MDLHEVQPQQELMCHAKLQRTACPKTEESGEKNKQRERGSESASKKGRVEGGRNLSPEVIFKLRTGTLLLTSPNSETQISVRADLGKGDSSHTHSCQHGGEQQPLPNQLCDFPPLLLSEKGIWVSGCGAATKLPDTKDPSKIPDIPAISGAMFIWWKEAWGLELPRKKRLSLTNSLRIPPQQGHRARLCSGPNGCRVVNTCPLLSGLVPLLEQ
ncbi:hypothetical protein Q8A73_016719 [Channa argus]|nr:hypothetical protein Q8A73_016719 [Channa argus]